MMLHNIRWIIGYATILQKDDKEKKKKETILDLSKYLDKAIRVKFSGGREGEIEFVMCCHSVTSHNSLIDYSQWSFKRIRPSA
jgi:hypothetical protein